MTERVHQICNAVRYAQELGTYGLDDRSKQYPIDDPEKIKDALNKCWTKAHRLERQLTEKEVLIGKLEKRCDRQKTWLWIVGSTNAALWALVLALIFR